MSGFCRALMDRLFAVVGVLVLCQFPLFIQQYEMRLSGHVAETARFVASIQQNAQASKKTLKEYVRKFVMQDDPDFARQGKLLEEVIGRHEELESDLQALQGASTITRPFVFFAHVKGDVLRETVQQFVPGLSFNVEAIVYGFIGLCLGFGFGACLAAVCSYLWRKLGWGGSGSGRANAKTP